MDRPGVTRAAGTALMLLALGLPLAALVAARAIPPVDAEPMPRALLAALLTVAAMGASLVGTVVGLRHGALSALLLAGAMAALASGALATLLGATSLVTPLALATLLMLGASGAERTDALITGRALRIMTMALLLVVGGAAVTVDVVAGPQPVIGLRGVLLAAAALVALAAVVTSFGRRTGLSAASLLVGAVALAFAREGAAELLVALAALTAAALLAAAAALEAARDPDHPEERLPGLVAHLADGVLRFDGRLRLREWNDAATEILSLDTSANGTRLEELLGVSLADLSINGAQKVLRSPIGGLQMEVQRTDSGVVVVLRDPRIAPESDRLRRELRGTIEELLQAQRTIDLQRAELERAATVDRLTGAASRRALLDRLRIEVAEARRYRHPVALVLIDIDGFSALNHAHGVTGGDAVLQEVALRTRLRVREADALGRAGCDAFLAILPHTDEGGAATFAHAVRQQLAMRPIGVEDERLSITVSIGVAVMRPGEDLDLDGLVARVEEALASARAAGGDRVALDRLHGLARLEPPHQERRRTASAPEEDKAQDSGT